MSSINEGERRNVAFAAIDPYIESNIIEPTETSVKDKGKSMVLWGEGNKYPEYLLDLYKNCSTLRSIIQSCVDYTVGDNVTSLHGNPNENGTIRDLVKLCALSYYLYGGFALHIIYRQDRDIAAIEHVDLTNLRTNEDFNVFYYSEEFTKKYARSSKIITYPAFMQGANDHDSSILYIKNEHTQVYPAPMYAAAVKACETERSIDIFHLNAINNGFVSSLFVNFNNGEPSDEMKEEIERNFNEKFAGAENAMRIGFSWNQDKEHATSFEQFKIEDFAAQYDSLSKHSRQQIFTAFRCNPNLCGIPTENNGFNAEEYESSFRLFNRTVIKPVQDMIVDAFDKIYNEKNSIQIIPFSM